MAHFRFVSLVTVAASSALLLTAVSTLAACADDPVTPGPKGDSGVPTFEDAGGAMDSSRPDQEAGPADPVVNQCTAYVDRTDPLAPRTVQWDLAVASLQERCMRIKAGQTLKFVDGAGVADFVAHPLLAYIPNGGGAGPVVNMTTGELTFPTAGAFGYSCEIHPQMIGGVIVE